MVHHLETLSGSFLRPNRHRINPDSLFVNYPDKYFTYDKKKFMIEDLETACYACLMHRI